jgi:hypothetical protein
MSEAFPTATECGHSHPGLQWIALLVVGFVKPSTLRRRASWITSSVGALSRCAETQLLPLLADGVGIRATNWEGIGGESRVGDEGMKGIN